MRRAVSTGAFRYFRPDRSVPESAVLFPERDVPHEALVNESIDRHFPDFEQRLHPPARLLLRYQEVAHVGPLLLALLTFASLASVAVAAVSRASSSPHQGEVVFLSGTALTLTFAAVATVELTLRYLIPTLPLLVCGGVLALTSLGACPAARLGIGRGVARISERDWSEIGQSDYEDADDYCAACLIDLNAKGEEKTKERCKLPVREPRSFGGKVNRNAVHAAAAVLAGGRGGVDAPADERRKAARKLVDLYRELDEDPPDALRKLARS